MTWEEYYEKIWEWKPSTMVKYMSELTTFGPSEEMMEVIVEISFGDKKGATGLLRKATDAGIKFTGEQLLEISGNCEEREFIRAMKFSADEFTDKDIDDLYWGYHDDELVVELAKKYKLQLPKEEPEKEEDTIEEIENFQEEMMKMSPRELEGEYDYILQCLECAREKMMLVYRLSISDMSSKKRSVSIMKHACLLEAEPFIKEAGYILETIESQVPDKNRVKNIQVNMGKNIVFADVYGDGFLINWSIQRRIKR